MPATGLMLTEEQESDVATVAVHGDLDLRTAPELCACLGAHRGEPMLIDLTSIGFCDSSGLRAIMGEARESAIQGGELHVVAPSGTPVRRLLELTGLTEAIAVHEDRADA